MPENNINQNYSPSTPNSPVIDIPNNTVNSQNPQNPFVNPSTNPSNYANDTNPNSGKTNLFRKYPAKTAYISSLIIALLLTFLPWVGSFSNNVNFYFLAGKNLFCFLYLLSLLGLIGIRFGIWFNINLFKPYYKIINYIETLLIGAIVMLVLTVGIYGDIQFGIVLSLISVLVSLSYITYIKAIKS